MLKLDDDNNNNNKNESENIFNNIIRKQINYEFSDLSEFLEEIKMTNYLDNFILKGFTKLSSLKNSNFIY